MSEIKPNSAKNDLLKLTAILIALVVVLTLAGRSFYTEYMVEKNEQTAKRVDVAEFLAAEKSIFGQYLVYKESQDSRTGELINEMEQLISRDSRKLGEQHPIVGDAYFHLGYMYQQDDKYVQGEKNLLTALEIYRNSIGEDHQYVGMTYGNLGHTQFSQGKYEQALDYYERGLENITRYYEPNAQDVQRIERMITKTKNQLNKNN